ncbi:RHS repeat-associated core domain-containing protein [Lysobacter yananisis]|uniref:RHS repeat-associated core domain-containing protein n=1 Tax=Lysobacter yananisis TaxID=1003114 RepID=A0ABY9PAF3_9GAMM|nr:RHS repeat-associated core domain-containing protein [Lysobacter yananisis]WMT04058.1 RHS repeat-associated core domain-containing protein [Lysobacter yananisis]
MTIAAKHFDPQLGIDIHTYLIPPSPIPIPLPTPHIGIVLDPFDYLPIIGGTVHVNGIKRATAGTMGLDVHIPVGGVWMPPLKIAAGPQWDDELFMGSKTVLADGDPFSKITMPVLACNVVGMVAPFRIRKPKKPHLSLLLPTTLNVAIPTNVYVGGPPTVSWTALLMTFGLPALGKLLKKTGVAGAAGAAFKELRQKLFANMKPGVLKCNILRAEPVDIRDGSVSVIHEDFAVPGRLPLAWRREYHSNDAHAGQCGRGWHTPADVRLEFDTDGSVLFLGPELPALFAHLPQGEGIEHAVREYVNGARLIREGAQWWVRTKDGLRYGFAAVAADAAGPQARSLPIQRIEDLCGNHWRFERSDGQLTRIVESGVDGLQGRFIDVESRQGRIERMQLHDPATGLNHPLVGYRYQDGDLVAAVDALDAARRFEYRQHRMVRHTDRVGLSFHYAYDARWRVVRAWGDGGLHDYKFRYDELLGETEITDSLGHVSLVKFDENGLPLCEIDPLDGVTAFEYDEVGRTTAVVDPMGLRTEFEYDGRGNLLTLTRADGGVLRTAYDADDRPVALTDPAGAEWTQIWDRRGLLIGQRTPTGAESHYEYSDAGQIATYIDPLGAAMQAVFDRHGQLHRATDPLGSVDRFEHDAMGRLLTHVDPAGRTTRYSHDGKGRLSRVVAEGGGRVQCEYDGEDRLIEHRDSNGAITRLEYSGIGQVARRIQPDGHAVGYAYDSEERLVAVVNQRGERYELRRDALGRVVEEIDYWGQSRRYRFDAGGGLVGCVDALGQSVAYRTDPLGRVVHKSAPDLERPGRRFEETFKYDKRGQFVELKNRHCHVLRKYDADGRLTEETQNGFRVANDYDAAGNRILRETSAGNRVACEFDSRGQPRRIAINDEAPVEIERDATGRATAERMGAHIRRDLSYDREGRLAAQSVMCGQQRLFETRYGYDPSDNLIERGDSEHGVDQYAYDPMGRLLAHTDPRGRIQHFLNDPAGDRLHARVRETRMLQAVGDQAQPSHWAREGDYEGRRYVFDRAGDLVQRSDARTLPTASEDDSGLRLRWDAHHRLVESRKDGQVTRYGYDPLGRRVFKRNPTQTTWFFWDGDALVGEVRQDNDAAGAPDPSADANVLDFFAARARKSAFQGLYPKVREFVYYPGGFVPLALIDKRSAVSAPAAAENTGANSSARSSSQTSGPSPLRDARRPVAARASGTAAGAAVEPRLERSRAPGYGALTALSLGPDRGNAASAPQGSGANAVSPLARESAAEGGAAAGAARPGYGNLAGSPSGANRDAAVEASSHGVEPERTASVVPSSPVAGALAAHADVADVGDLGAAQVDAASRVAIETLSAVVLYYHADPNGCSTRMTWQDGRVAWAATYSPSGKALRIVADAVDNPIRLQGQYFDPETELHYNRYRYYDSDLAQYVGQDPIRLTGGEGLYSYGFNPVGWIDPRGLTCTPAQVARMKELVQKAYDDMVAQGVGKAKRGPCFSIAMDMRTGRMSAVYNNHVDGAVPGNLHPDIESRLPGVPPYVTENGLPLSKGAGSHSEVYAVNELLNNGTGAKLDDIAVWSMESFGNKHAPVGAVKDPCPHCGHLLDGVTYVQ